MTSTSVLLPDEQQQRLGVKPPPGERSIAEVAQQADQELADLKARAQIRGAGLPAAFDLRNVAGANYVTPIKDQKNCGSCVAFGVVATVESRLRKQRANPNLAVDLSEAHLFFVHARARGYNCDTDGGRPRRWKTLRTRASWTRHAIRMTCPNVTAAVCAPTPPTG